MTIPWFRRPATLQYNPNVKLSEIGEFGLIERLRRLVDQRQRAALASSTRNGGLHGLLLGIGDDCAVWRYGDVTQLATTDTLVQGVHFILESTSWQDLGWKALAINLSDIAAMGGVPHSALVTLGLPETVTVEGIEALYQGMLDCGHAYSTLLTGGDIVSAPLFFITVTVVGHASGKIPYPNNVLLRSSAVASDAIAVTGYLGSSAAGLKLLKAGTHPPALSFALDAHRRPVPRISTGQLALEAGVRCGMDVSDGLVGDLEKLCAASGIAAEVEMARLPVRQELREHFPQEWAGLALTGGEDYELLLTGPAEVLEAVRERSDVPLSIIGRMQQGAPGQVTVRNEDGTIVKIGPSGWDHLRRG